MFPIPNDSAHILIPIYLPTWTLNQSRCIFSVTITGFRFKSFYVPGLLESHVTGVHSAIDSVTDTGFCKLLSVLAKLYTPHMPKFHIPTIGNCRNNSKTVPIRLYFVDFEDWGIPALFTSVLFLRQNTRYLVCSIS